MSYDITTFSVNEVIIYLRKSRSDDPALTVEEVLFKHETQLQEYALTVFGDHIPEYNIFREVVSGEPGELLLLLNRPDSPVVIWKTVAGLSILFAIPTHWLSLHLRLMI